MKLSEAIKIGSTFRREGRSGPFVRIANTEELASDVWGAACEAVYSLIAKRNWDKDDKVSYDSDIAALKEVQEKYFADYFKLTAFCPGAKPRTISHTRGRFSGRVVGGLNELVIGSETHETVQGVTTACPAITNLAELVEHCFYIHNWTREECAEAVEWYEQQSAPLIVENFQHYQDNAVVKRTAQRLTSAAIERQLQRQQRRSQFLAH